VKINKDNYEIWFLDYTEGNLTETQLSELKSFVEQYPELKDELEDFELISLDDVEDVFPDKDLLKKKSTSRFNDFVAYHEGDLNEAEKQEVDQYISNNLAAKIEFDQLAKMYLEPDMDILFSSKSDLRKNDVSFSTDDFIAYHEGDLNEHDQKTLLAFLHGNDEGQAEFDRLASLYLIADGNIVYPNKASLKKKEGKIIYLNWQYIAAAASILLVLGMFFFQEKTVIIDDNSIVKNEIISPPIDSTEDNNKKIFPVENKNVENDLANDQGKNDEVPMKGEPSKNKIPTPIIKSPSNLAAANPSITNEVIKKGSETIEKNEREMILPVILEAKPFKSIALESDKPNKLKASDNIPPINFANEFENKPVETNSQQSTQPITVLAFVEQKAANIVSDERSDKIRLFDVLKKVGEKSRLYDLKEADDNKYSLKIAKLELEGKRKKVAL
jgi:hypothetical protein